MKVFAGLLLCAVVGIAAAAAIADPYPRMTYQMMFERPHTVGMKFEYTSQSETKNTVRRTIGGVEQEPLVVTEKVQFVADGTVQAKRDFTGSCGTRRTSPAETETYRPRPKRDRRRPKRDSAPCTKRPTPRHAPLSGSKGARCARAARPSKAV